MKKQLFLSAILFSFSGSLLAAESLCQQKEQGIQREIDMAKKRNNQRRVTGLERALTEVRANCTDEKRKPTHSKRITAQKHKIAERELQEELKGRR